MNVVLEQIRRLYEIPKGVMHYIVHLVRPRAPPQGPDGWWRRWTVLGPTLNWYHYTLTDLRLTRVDGYTIDVFGRPQPNQTALCRLCARLIQDGERIFYCNACNDSLQ